MGPRRGAFAACLLRRGPFQVLIQIASDELEQVHLRVLSLAHAVGPVGVLHHGERLVGGHQGVDQHLGVLEVHVVIAAAVNQQEIALETVHIGQR